MRTPAAGLLLAFALALALAANGCAGAEAPNAGVDGAVAADGASEAAAHVDSASSDVLADVADSGDGADARVDDAILDSPADAADTAAGDVDVAESDVAGTELVFPSATDPGDYVDSVSHRLSVKGNYVAGTRTTTRASVSSFSTTLQVLDGLVSDGAGAGTLRLDVSLNGTKIGSVVIDPTSGDAVPMAFDFPAVVGPIYALEYRVFADVAVGYGWVDLRMDVSRVSLR